MMHHAARQAVTSALTPFDYDFGNTDFILDLLSKLSATLRDYLRELADNAFDSIFLGPDSDKKEYLIEIIIDKRNGRIIVEDNARGITFGRLVQIVTEIGGGAESKRQVAMSIVGSTSRQGQLAKIRGMNQVGMHGWRVFGESCIVTSKAIDGDGRTYTLIMGKQGNTFTKPLIGPASSERHQYGTTVELRGIDPETLNNRINLRNWLDYFGHEYRRDLDPYAKPRVVLAITTIPRSPKALKQMVYVEPAKVVGIPFSLSHGREEKTVEWVDSHMVRHREVISITGTVVPNRKDGRVRIWWGRRRVYNDITEIPEFECSPWNLGCLDLDIVAGWVPTDAAKRAFIDDPEGRFSHFKRALHELENYIKRCIQDLEEEAVPKRSEHLRRSLESVLDVFSELGYEINPGGQVLRPQLGGEHEVNVPGDRLARPGGRKGTSPIGGGLTALVPPQGQFDPNRPARPAKARPKIDVLPVPMSDEPDRRYGFYLSDSGQLVAIKINIIHSDYLIYVEPNPSGDDANLYTADQFVQAIYECFYEKSASSLSEAMRELSNLRWWAFGSRRRKKRK